MDFSTNRAAPIPANYGPRPVEIVFFCATFSNRTKSASEYNCLHSPDVQEHDLPRFCAARSRTSKRSGHAAGQELASTIIMLVPIFLPEWL
jgi:hypothetical protein